MNAHETMLLTAEEAAKELQVSKPIMYDLTKTDGFPTVRIGRKVMVSRKGLERWIEERAGTGIDCLSSLPADEKKA